jgi:hypothetical protein
VKMNKKVFISQPMASKSDDEILSERNKAIKKVKSSYPNDNIEILDSFFGDYNGNAVQFLGKSILLLGEADLIVLISGWSEARGCVIEEAVAKAYNIECMYL